MGSWLPSGTVFPPLPAPVILDSLYPDRHRISGHAGHHHATLCIAAYGFLVAERNRFSPSARAGHLGFVVPRPAPDFRPRGSPPRHTLYCSLWVPGCRAEPFFPLCPRRSSWIRCTQTGTGFPATRVAAHVLSDIIHIRLLPYELSWRA